MSENIVSMTEQQVQAEMNTLRNVFSTVRLLSEGEVRAQTTDCSNKRIVGDCYEVWKRQSPCRNCISYRALTEKGQFTKIEKTAEGTFQVIADYREVDGKPCVLEMIKKFDQDIVVDFADEDRDSERLGEYFEKTYTDVLTGLYNRRYYEEYLANQTFNGAIAMLDLDDFKIYNDLFGHDIGDIVIKAVASAIKSCVRSDDKVIRYGGDEFLLVMSGIGGKAFQRCMNDIAATVKRIVIDDYPAIKPSVSAGGKLCNNEVIRDCVRNADELMYYSKKMQSHHTAFGSNDGDNRVSKKKRLLVVDDSELNREILSGILQSEYSIVQASDGREAVKKIELLGNDISAILLDIIMPEMNGFDVLDYMNRYSLIGEIPVIAITGDESGETIRAAYDKGVSDYIIRPFDAKVVYKRVSNTVKVYERQKQLASEISRELRNKEKNRSMILEILNSIVESPGSETDGNHAEHMMRFTELLLEKLVKLAPRCGFTQQDIYAISTAAALHDIGKSQIDHAILNKKGKLTAEEFEIIKTHTVLGEAILNNIKVYANEPLVEYAKVICRSHHERFDGKGYPDGLKGDDIPVVAQVVSICDVYDALVSKRAYKPAYTHEQAMQMICDGQCGTFNPIVMQCLEESAYQLKQIVDKTKHNE